MRTKFNLLNNLLFIGFFLMFPELLAQGILGKWKVANSDGRINSIIEIYEDGDVIQGKVIKITKEEDRDRKCTQCPGELKNKPIVGLRVIRDFVKVGNEYIDGTLINPTSGREYKGKIWIDEANPNKLNVRGYIAFFYKTKIWERAE